MKTAEDYRKLGDWIRENAGLEAKSLPIAIRILWMMDRERWEAYQREHTPNSLEEGLELILSYLKAAITTTAAQVAGPPAEGECLLSPSPPAEGECLLSPSPPAEGKCLLSPSPPAEGKCLLVLPPQPEWEEPERPQPKGEEPERPTPEWEEPERPTPEWEEPERPTPEWEEPERPTPEWEEPERPTPEWEEPERPTPEWEEPERPTPEWEEPERPTPEWEEPERPTPEWEEPERPTPEWEEPERPTPEWEEPERPTPEWEEPERPTPEWEEPERPTPEWEEPERPTPEWEEPERPTPEWEEPERPTPEWEEPERPTPEWEEPERPTPEWEEPERPTPEWEEPERPTPEWEEPERPTPEWGEPERPQPKRGESVRPQPKEGGVGASIAQEGEGGACRALGPKLPAEGECLLVPPPPAEGECLLSPCAPAEDECLLSPSPPAEGECLLGPRPPAEDECLLVSLPPPALTPAREGDKPQSPARKAEPHQSPAREAEQDQSPAKGGDYTLLPPSSPGDHMLLPPPLLPPQEPEGEELQAPPPENFWGGEGQDAGVPQQPLFMLLKAARRAPAQPPQRREPAPPGAEELELPLPPVPPPQGGRWPEPQKGELPATKKGEEVWRPLSPAAVSLQEFLWPEPHRRELPAMKKGEVGGPPAPAAISLQEWTSMLSAVPLPAGGLTALPAMGPLKPPVPARDFVLDFWDFKGGVGKVGQNSLTACGGDLLKAKDIFKKKFLDKTKNEWDERAQFEKVAGKYDIVQMDYSTKEDDEVKKESKAQKHEESKLDKRVQSLIELISNIKAMEECILEMKFDTKKAPLGKLTVEQIKAGYQSLKKVEDCINSNTMGRALLEACNEFYTRVPHDFGNTMGRALLEACNEFYTRVPHDFGLRTPPLIRTEQELKDKITLLEALSDIEIVIKMVKSSLDSTEHPLDKQYSSLHCELSPLEHSTQEFQILKKYLQSTHASTHSEYTMSLLDVFSIEKEGESEAFRRDINNRILEKYLQSTHASTHSEYTMSLLDVFSIEKEGESEAFRRDINNRDGASVPMGPVCSTGVNNPEGYTLLYNEYIVYNPAQVRMKYLLKVQFNFESLW
ncbi:UNVERIFIED_CONTAM: hypothetical protein FKN15_009380 [Acipenser sinensis]